MTKINLNEIEVGDVFSEQVHYTFIGKNNDSYEFKHLGSGSPVKLNSKYVEDLLQTADQYQTEVEVGKEDKLWTAKQITDAVKAGTLKADHQYRVGDIRQKGIRSIWADIHSSQVFTVSFNKQAKELTKKALLDAKQQQLDEAIKAIEAARIGKKGVAKIAEEAIKKIQDNPVLPIQAGDERILRGYKIEFTSITGQYDVVDMDIDDPKGNVRKVNVNEINYLVYGGVKYIVK